MLFLNILSKQAFKYVYWRLCLGRGGKSNFDISSSAKNARYENTDLVSNWNRKKSGCAGPKGIGLVLFSTHVVAEVGHCN